VKFDPDSFGFSLSRNALMLNAAIALAIYNIIFARTT
jgi:hypothetical protein